MSRPRGHVQHSARKPDAFWPQVVLKSDLENHFSSLVDGSFCARTSRPCARCFRKPSRFAAEAAISLAQAGWAHPAGRKTLLGSLDGGGGWELADREVIVLVKKKDAGLLPVVKILTHHFLGNTMFRQFNSIRRPRRSPGHQKGCPLRRMNPAVRNWNMPLLDASFRILVPLHQNRSRHVNCFQAHKA